MVPALRQQLLPHALLLLLVAQMTLTAVPVLQFDRVQTVLESFGSSDSDALAGLPFPHPAKPVTLPVASPSKSFWVDSPGANPLAKVGSEGELIKDADVCVIGAGITGVSAAYHLARMIGRDAGDGEAKRSITVLEARDFCSGATGRNGGHLRSNPFSDFAQRAALYGAEDAVRSYDLEEYTTQELLRIIRENGASEDVDLVSEGRVTLFMTPEEEESARVDFEAAKAAGLGRLGNVKWIDRETMNETRGTSFPGIWTPGNNLWPLKAVALLFKLAAATSEKVNVTLHTHTPVTSVEPSPGSTRRYIVGTPRGTINCDYVVHATNGYANYLLDPAKSKVRIVPTRGQIIIVPAVAGTGAVGKTGWTANQGFEYWFPRPVKDADGEQPLVVLGGGREAMAPGYEYYETDDGVVNKKIGTVLRSFLPRMFPGLYDDTSRPTWEWTGIMGYSLSGNPFVGPLPTLENESSSHQYVSAGYTGHGMPRAYACAEAVAGMIVADMTKSEWTAPEWFPRHYHTNHSRDVY